MTPIQAQTVMFLFILGTAILNIPAIITALAKQDAWLSVPLAALIGWLTPLMVVILCQMHKRRSLVDVCQSVMGPYAGALLGAGYVFYAIHLGVLVTNDAGMFETMMLQPRTPLWLFHLLILVVAVYAYRLGPEILGRFSQMLLIIVIVVIALTFLLLIGRLHPENLLPILGGGWRRLAAGAYPAVGFPFLETVIVTGWILPQVEETTGFLRGMTVAYFLGAVFLALAILFTLMVFGAEWSAHLTYPLYALAQQAGITDVIERIEALTLIAWIACVQIKLIVCFAFALDGIRTLLRVPDARLFSIPLAVAMMIFAETSVPSEVYLTESVNIYWTPYSSVFGVFAPLLLLAVTWIRRMGKKRRKASF
ncbi:spore germination protein (amino acid permease) [Planifilum fimeticola]|uniref:Spore germination protein (Amino acid permease) n=2 Tax=Planifilum fimeticola TaxID=201975 RepID=A0A2T0LBA1_9BACL|nr:spore germination protein (amino acid permease) [Planifilum fimeticola]